MQRGASVEHMLLINDTPTWPCAVHPTAGVCEPQAESCLGTALAWCIQPWTEQMKHNLRLQYLPIILSMIIPLVVISYKNSQCRGFSMLGKLFFILKGKRCKIGAFDLDLWFIWFCVFFVTVKFLGCYHSLYQQYFIIQGIRLFHAIFGEDNWGYGGGVFASWIACGKWTKSTELYLLITIKSAPKGQGNILILYWYLDILGFGYLYIVAWLNLFLVLQAALR